MDPGDILTLVIEYSIAIVGFSGIVIVLGRRESGEWTAVDRLRLTGLLNASFAPISMAGFALILLASKVPSEMVWKICSSAYALLYLIFASRGIRRATKLDPSEKNTAQIFVVVVSVAAIITLLIFNAIKISSFWPFAIALAFHTALGLFNFVGLLMNAISDGNAS